MKKNTFWKSLFLLCSLVVGSVNAWGEDVLFNQSNFTNKSLAVGSGELTWQTSTDASSYESSQSARGVAWSNGATFTLTAGQRIDNISKVVIYAATNGTGNALDVKIENETFTKSQTNFTGNSLAEYTFTHSAISGTLKIVKTGSNKSTWIKWIKVYCEGYALTLTPAINGSYTVKKNNVTVNSGEKIIRGTILNLVATADDGYSFVNWSATAGTIGNATQATTTFTMPASATTLSATFEEESTATLVSITISGTPTKTTYVSGEEFDPTGLTVTGTYDDDSNKDITAKATFASTPNTLTTGTTSVNVVATVDAIESSVFPVAITVNKADAAFTVEDIVLSDVDIATTILPNKTAGDGSSYSYEITSGNDVISITNGKVKPLKAGTAAVTATLAATTEYNSATHDFTVTVNEATINNIVTFGGDDSDTYQFQDDGQLKDKNDMVAQDIKMTWVTNSGTNNAYFDGTVVRFYTSNTMTITPQNGVSISKIEIIRQATTSSNSGTISANINNVSQTVTGTTTGTNIWEGSTSLPVSFTASAQARFTKVKVTYEIPGIQEEVKSVAYSTMYYSNKNLIVPEGVEAFAYYTTDGETLTKSHTYSEGDIIPAGTAVVISATAAKYNFLSTSTSGTVPTNNSLKGYDEDHITEGSAGDAFYILSLPSGSSDATKIGFYYGAENGAAFTSKAHKAYLACPKQTSAKAFLLNDETTGIDAIENKEMRIDNTNAPMYNLAGQRVNKNYKGVVIQNGKKVIKK